MLYRLGIGLELLSACLVAEVCQASNVFLIRKEPLSMTLELSKCFAMFDPLAHVLTFLTCSFLRVKWAAPQENSNSLAVSPFINVVTQPVTRILRRHNIQVENKPSKT